MHLGHFFVLFSVNTIPCCFNNLDVRVLGRMHYIIRLVCADFQSNSRVIWYSSASFLLLLWKPIFMKRFLLWTFSKVYHFVVTVHLLFVAFTPSFSLCTPLVQFPHRDSLHNMLSLDHELLGIASLGAMWISLELFIDAPKEMDSNRLLITAKWQQLICKVLCVWHNFGSLLELCPFLCS